MAKTSALLVGLKSVDPACYDGWDGANGCWGCELDVENMARILKSCGHQIQTLKTAEATRNKILSSLYLAAENRVAGDVFVFYYSGHGGQQPDISGDELDGKDETLVAYDREIIDDKIHNMLTKFRSGVHTIMISDSCNSGTNYRGRKNVNVDEGAIFRPVARSPKREVDMKAQLIHLGGCRDGFTSAGYDGGGAFTMALCEAWNNGIFQGTLKDLHNEICRSIRSDQKPQYSEYGPVSDAFRNQRAFDIPGQIYTAKTISASVGIRGKNHYDDVCTVQELLNTVPYGDGGPRPKLDVDGKCGRKTEKAIQQFQLHHFGWKLADGRVDPDGPTMAKLNRFTSNCF